MSSWDPNSNLGEDGLPNMDKANYPFWVTNLQYLYNNHRNNLQFLTKGPDEGDFYMKNNIWRITGSINGYVSLGDAWILHQRSENSNWGDTNVRIVLIKEKSGDVARPYAKKFEEFVYPFQGADWANSLQHRCGFATKGDNKGLYVLRPLDVDGGRYLTIGNVVGGLDQNGTRIYEKDGGYAVRSDLVINLRGQSYGYDSNMLGDPTQFESGVLWKGGRKLADVAGSDSGCNLSFWSTALIIDQTSGQRLFLHPWDGYIHNDTGVDWASETNKPAYYMKYYQLMPLKSKFECCKATQSSNAASKCGWGSFIYSKEKPECIDYGREICNSGNETLFTSDFCLTNICKSKPDDQNPIICDREYSKFCSVKDSTGKYINYEKYPDICACFMPQDFLTKGCDDMANQLTLRNNKAAMKVLNIDTTDPDQCNQNCAVNPLCRLSLMVPNTSDYPENRRNKPIIKGGLVDKSKCGDRTICIQSAVINNEGKVGKKSINQQASCQNVKKGNCAQSIFSTCSTTNGSGLFTKTLLQEKDQGACGTTNQVFECANFDLTPIYDKCINGKRIISYNQKQLTFNKGVVRGGINFETTTFDIDENDAVNALTSIINNNEALKKTNAVASFCKECRMGLILADCQDCILGMEPLGTCYIDGNVWKQKFRKSKIVQSPSGGGKACPTTFEEKTDFCSLDKDCKLIISENDQGCVDGVRRIKYNIAELNSGNGKSCEDVAMSMVPQIFKDNSPAVKVSGDFKTVTTEISCQDCVIDYQIDNSYNNGKCFWDGLKWTVRKIPVYQKRATGGGTCPIDKVSLVERKVPIIEQCKSDQDCEINSEPITDVCDDKTGERNLVFNITKVENGKGITCNDLSKEFVKKYDLLSSSYDANSKKLSVKTKCNVSQDCVLSNQPVDSICDTEQGLGVDLYNIEKQASNKGLDCDKVIKSKVNYDVYTVEENGQLYVYKSCEAKNKNTKYIIYGVAILLVLIFSILAIVL